jgi:dipeptidyl aminopeptidase/acylaminoacyl peptidase
MKILKAPLLAVAAGIAALGSTAVLPVPASAQTGQEVPIDVWSLRSVVNAVQVSPDGKHVLVHKLESKEGEYLLEIYSTDDLSKPVRRLNADPMEIIQAFWVSDNYISGTAWEVVRKRVTRPEEDIRSYKAFGYNLAENKFTELSGNFQFVSLLPDEPNTVIVAEGRAIADPTGEDPLEAFRPRAYYRFDLERGTKSLLIKGNEKHPSFGFDAKGNPRISQGFDRASGEIRLYHRMPGESSWGAAVEAFSVDMDVPENLYRGFFSPRQFSSAVVDASRPELSYVIDIVGDDDTTSLWVANLETGALVEKLAQVEGADITGLQSHSIPGNDKLVAAVYPGAKPQRIWFDEEEKALHEALESQIPEAYFVRITSRSRDGNTMIVQNTGPQDPGSYWLVKDGKIAKLGSRNPLLDPKKLAAVEYVEVTARDGLRVPAYVMKPKGEGPFPLVVQHNGGPSVNGMVLFDEWSQMLVDNGYMVVHPQIRISTGWGKNHFNAGYGEHGLAMQDDKDDVVLDLIKRGWADPDRVAFFGWSYGGQAALYALTRTPQLYQCSIAGAAVADPEKQYLGRRNPYDPKPLDEWSKRRGMIGVNPINEVDKVNIPLLMIHPKNDRRVMYYHFEDYKKAMEKAGKVDAQYVTLEGADHFSNTHMFNHQKVINTKILEFLKNDCGPGGL